MACNCCNCRTVRAQSVAITGTSLTITVPADTDLTSIGCLRIGIFTTIPTTVGCANIIVTNGTESLNIFKDDGNYWRPSKLCCRSIIRTRVLDDPAHLLIEGVSR